MPVGVLADTLLPQQNHESQPYRPTDPVHRGRGSDRGVQFRRRIARVSAGAEHVERAPGNDGGVRSESGCTGHHAGNDRHG